MKHKCLLLLVLGLATMWFVGCEQEQLPEDETHYPQSVDLIAPGDGSDCTDSTPEFMWSSDSLATSYILRIALDDFSEGMGVYQDTLKDTTWMGKNLFSQIYRGDYEWAVAPLPAEDDLLWSDWWEFNVDKATTKEFLVSPQDGAVFTSQAPTFTWFADDKASSYVIRIVKDAFFSGVVIAEDTITDTTFTMSEADFKGSLNSDYMWGVACVYGSEGVTWKGLRTFALDKPSIELDLDTTYFPMGLDHSWTYETYSMYYYWESPYPPDEEYDTVTIQITDSLFGEDGWLFYLSRSFFDTGDTVSILGNKVYVYRNQWISINPESGEYDAGIDVNYEKDTVCISRHTSGHYSWDGYLDAYWSCDWEVNRLKGVGVVYERYYYNDRWGQNGEESRANSSTLLYFCKGSDTVWRRQP